MKKIKYIILTLLLLFLLIPNVKAECTNLVDFNASGIVLNNSGSSSILTKLSSNSYYFVNNTRDYAEMRFANFKPPTTSNYIITFVFSGTLPDNLTFYISRYNGSSPLTSELLSDVTNNNRRIVKYRFNLANPSATTLTFNIYSLTNSDFTASYYIYPEDIDSNCPVISHYTYRFMVDEEVYATDTVEEGTVIELPEPPTKEGYTFTGWTLNGEEYTGGAISSDIDIIANFTENQQESGETTPVNLSGIIPYLVLISALITLFIEINFIKSLLKSRR